MREEQVMNMIRTGLCFVLATVVATTVTAQQNLDPVFQVSGVNGDCKISLPGQDDFRPVEEFKTYPYGSRIITANRSSLVMAISEGNVVRVLANADLVFNEDPSNTRIKNVRLNDGEVEVELRTNFHENGNALNVETATATCGAVGTHFRVASRLEQDLRIVIFRVIRGLIRVYGENFEVPEMKADDWLSLLSPSDRSFLRLKNMKGAFDIRIKDENMNDRNMPTREGFVLKIWQQVVPETGERVVTAVLTSPAGELIETVSVTFGPEGERKDGEPGDIGWNEDPAKTRKQRRQERGGENPQPPEDFMDELIRNVMDNVNVEFFRAPLRPTPTPVGRR